MEWFRDILDLVWFMVQLLTIPVSILGVALAANSMFSTKDSPPWAEAIFAILFIFWGIFGLIFAFSSLIWVILTVL